MYDNVFAFICIKHFYIIIKVFRLTTEDLIVIVLFLFKVFRLLRKTFLLFYCFFFSIIKVFRFQRKTLLLLYAFSFFTIIIIFLSSTRVFFGHFSVDFLEIFRKNVFLWKDFACKISSCISLPVWSYRPFSDFLKVLLVHVSPPLFLKLES